MNQLNGNSPKRTDRDTFSAIVVSTPLAAIAKPGRTRLPPAVIRWLAISVR